MIEGTLWRVRWCRVFPGRLYDQVITGDPRESFLFDCPGRHSINFGSWVNSCFCHFRFFDERDRMYWASVLVIMVEEVEDV